MPRKPVVATHNVPSGMGGSFDVVVIDKPDDCPGPGRCWVKVISPRNRDWHGFVTTALLADLKPLTP